MNLHTDEIKEKADSRFQLKPMIKWGVTYCNEGEKSVVKVLYSEFWILSIPIPNIVLSI